MDQSPLGNILGHLAQMSERQSQLHLAQNEVLSELAQSLAEDRTMLRELIKPGGGGEGPRPANPQIHIPKMGEADDAEAFLETFQRVAEVSGWPHQEWAHRLLPLLTGEAQRAAHSLPGGAQRDYEAITKAIRDRLGLYPEEHRRRFRALAFGEGDRPFVYAQQIRDQARRWLVPDQNTAEEVVDQVVLERFIEERRTSSPKRERELHEHCVCTVEERRTSSPDPDRPFSFCVLYPKRGYVMLGLVEENKNRFPHNDLLWSARNPYSMHSTKIPSRFIYYFYFVIFSVNSLFGSFCYFILKSRL
ncbi:hypothetical protein N1851_021908 [Merluccius polli]|uniref:SCAN box domain-containing protein n=1 Tax=Merluccius polli TaxID=89951 RepID=A0AA47NWC3_MERPO|nr:hypothetical protein N1851_021908 [Merluccius polli]